VREVQDEAESKSSKLAVMLRMSVWFVFASACGFQVAASGDASVAVDGDIVAIDAAVDAPVAPVTVTLPITADTYVDASSAQTNYGGDSRVHVDGDKPATALLLVDLSSIPVTATLIAADLHIWTDNTGASVSVYKVLEAWDENAANVNIRKSGEAWSGRGASPPSRDTTELGTISPDTSNTEKTVSLTALVQGWVTAPATNFGIALATTSRRGSGYHSRESNSSASTRRPFFTITYQP
jgi:hypothetical protein